MRVTESSVDGPQRTSLNNPDSNFDSELANDIVSVAPRMQSSDEFSNSIDAGQSRLPEDYAATNDNSVRSGSSQQQVTGAVAAGKRLPGNKSSTRELHRTSSITTDRLTRLELSNEHNRETILSTAQTNSLDTIGNKNQGSYDDNNNEKLVVGSGATVSSRLVLVTGISLLLLLILLALIIYRWFYKSSGGPKKREVRVGTMSGDKSALCDDDPHWSPHSSPTKDQDLRGRTNYHHPEQDTIVTYVAGGGGRPTSCAPVTFAGSVEETNRDDADVIERIETMDDAIGQGDENRKPTAGATSKRPVSTMVTWRRKLSKSSVFAAAKSSARPKVRLISDKVRKFIDDEAADMKAQSAKRTPSLAGRIASYLFAPTSSKGESKSDSEDEGQSMPLVVKVGAQGGEKKAAGDSDLKETSLSTGQQVPSSSTKGLLEAGGHLQKLSPAPSSAQLGVNLADACSSISGCSLFSASPLNQENSSTPTCNCTRMLDQSGLLPTEFRHCSHSPHPLSAEVGGEGPSPVAVYRTCCSASPLVVQKQVPLQQQQRATACYHSTVAYLPHHQQQQQQVHEALRVRLNSIGHWNHHNNSNNMKHHGDSHLLGDKSSSYRIKRQYENYYDDEHEDAYRRLTASIGMELGFGVHHHPTTCLPDTNLHHMHEPTAAPFAPVDDPAFFVPHQSQHPLCKCCTTDHQRLIAPTATNNHSASGTSLHPPSGSPYLFGRPAGGGSAGELLSVSASTSLGGSDSGFVVSTHNNYTPGTSNPCRDPLCACRSGSPPVAAPTMSILVQQPSFATPPPQHPHLQESAMPEVSGSSGVEDSAVTEEKLTKTMSPMVKSCSGQTKWRHRRRLSQRVRTDLHGNHTSSRHCNSDRRPRRMSVAGDQVSGQLARRATTCNAGRSPQPAQIPPNSTVAVSSNLQHRASMDAGYWQPNQHQKNQPMSPATPNSHPPKQTVAAQQPGQSYPLHHNQTEPLFGSAVSKSHRPSDASLYEVQSCSSSGGHAIASMNGKCSYSSSTSSGIGVSASTCTNTPTTCAFPYGSFATNGPADLHGGDFPSPLQLTAAFNQAINPQTRGHAGYQWLPPQCDPMLYNLSHGVAGGVAQAALDSLALVRCKEGSLGPSRKYSLPVQLESQAAERLSPNRARPLFEKNLHRVDSATNANQQQLQQQHNFGPPNGESFSQVARRGYPTANQYPDSSNAWRQVEDLISARPTRVGLADSRRSSQTITRQSSFWLDEDYDNCTKVDSMLSMSMAGPSSSYDEHQTVTDASEQCKPASSSQRPSLGSLVLSGDSIESVKQRPPPVEQPRLEPSNTPAETEQNKTPPIGTSNNNNREERPNGGSSNFQRLMRNRLSSSTSTSSAASSPSPDFSRPSERILALASKSSSISKRHLMAKLHRRTPKRLPRLGSTTSSSSSGSTNTDPVIGSKVLSSISASSRCLSTRRESSKDADTEYPPGQCNPNGEKQTGENQQSVEQDLSVADGELPGKFFQQEGSGKSPFIIIQSQ